MEKTKILYFITLPKLMDPFRKRYPRADSVSSWAFMMSPRSSRGERARQSARPGSEVACSARRAVILLNSQIRITFSFIIEEV